MHPLSNLFGRLARAEGWLLLFCYGLFIFSTFSMAGMELSVIMLHLLVLYHLLRYGISDRLPLWVYLPFLLLAGAAVISSLISLDPLDSLDRARHDYRLFLPLVLLPALAAVDLRRVLKVYVVFLGVIAVYCVLQFGWNADFLAPRDVEHVFGVNGFARTHARGTFTNYLTLSGVMLMPAVIFASLFLSDLTRQRWVWAAGGVFAAVSVVLSMGRSGWLGMTVGLMVLTLRLPRRWAIPLVSVFVVALALIGYLSATGWVRDTFQDHVSSPLLYRFVSTSLERDGERILLWRAALRGIGDAPLFGHGLNYGAYDRYRDELAAEWVDIQLSLPGLRPHNTFLRVAFSLGLVGLAAFVGLWGALFVWSAQWIRRAGAAFPFERGLLWGCCGALGGSLVQGFFGNHYFDAEIQINILMWMGVILHTGMRIRRGLDAASPAAP